MTNSATTATAPSTPSAQRSDTEAFEALVAEHGLTVEEWNPSTLDEALRSRFLAFCVEDRRTNHKRIIVPAGQDPAHRLAAVRALLAHPGVTA